MTRTIELWYNKKNGLRGYNFFDTIPQAKKELRRLNKEHENLNSIIHVQYFDSMDEMIEEKSISYYIDNGKIKSI